jgi:hypothetical protein
MQACGWTGHAEIGVFLSERLSERDDIIVALRAVPLAL